MRVPPRLLLALVLALAPAACANNPYRGPSANTTAERTTAPDATTGPTTTADPTVPTQPFLGGRYPIADKQRIDALAAAKDCGGLEQELDRADQINDEVEQRTGEGTADLSGYIDEREIEAGCHQ